MKTSYAYFKNYFLSLRYSANFGRSPFILYTYDKKSGRDSEQLVQTVNLILYWSRNSISF